MQSVKRLVHAKNNRVWSAKQTTLGSLTIHTTFI